MTGCRSGCAAEAGDGDGGNPRNAGYGRGMNPALRLILEDVFVALAHARRLYGDDAPSADVPAFTASREPMTALRQRWAAHHHPGSVQTVAAHAPAGRVNPAGREAVARYIYQQARARGYSPHDATAIVAYSLGESGLDPTVSGGVQGDAEVIGLFQEKPGFAAEGGVSPADRYTVEGNTTAYLNQLERHRGQGDIFQQLLATSVGGPMYTGGYPKMRELMGRAAVLLGGAA